jgi:hypothetical protein
MLTAFATCSESKNGSVSLKLRKTTADVVGDKELNTNVFDLEKKILLVSMQCFRERSFRNFNPLYPG